VALHEQHEDILCSNICFSGCVHINLKWEQNISSGSWSPLNTSSWNHLQYRILAT
jgi:hypothetical protein